MSKPRKTKPGAAPKILSPAEAYRPLSDEENETVAILAGGINVELCQGERRFFVSQFGNKNRIRDRVVQLCEDSGWIVTRGTDAEGDHFLLRAAAAVPAGRTSAEEAARLLSRCTGGDSVDEMPLLTDPRYFEFLYRLGVKRLRSGRSGGKQSPDWQRLQDAAKALRAHHGL